MIRDKVRVGHRGYRAENRVAYKMFVRKTLLGRPRCRCENTTKMH
jgi:hypothetical protein